MIREAGLDPLLGEKNAIKYTVGIINETGMQTLDKGIVPMFNFLSFITIP